MPMDHRDRHHHAKAKKLAEELGLKVMDVDEATEITAEQWRTWANEAPTRRMIGWIAEGLVACLEASELAEIQRRSTKGLRPAQSNELAKEQVLSRQSAEEYRRLLKVIAVEANKS